MNEKYLMPRQHHGPLTRTQLALQTRITRGASEPSYINRRSRSANVVFERGE